MDKTLVQYPLCLKGPSLVSGGDISKFKSDLVFVLVVKFIPYHNIPKNVKLNSPKSI
jgi:hypothetical protein